VNLAFHWVAGTAPSRPLNNPRPFARLKSNRLYNHFNNFHGRIHHSDHKEQEHAKRRFRPRRPHQLGQILKRTAKRDERFVMDRRGKPSVIVTSVRDYIRNIAPTPAAYQAVRPGCQEKREQLVQYT
jgi:hypothetical protein